MCSSSTWFLLDFFLTELGSCPDYLGESVLTQRDSIRKLILQVKDLAKSLQELQDHQGLSKELWRQSGPHRDRTGQILEDTQEGHQVAVNECGRVSLVGGGLQTFRSSHSISSLGLFHSFSRSAYFFFSSFSFSRSCQSHSKHQQ